MRTKEKTLGQIVIFTIAFLLFVNIWPIGNIKNHDISKAQGKTEYYEKQTSKDKIITHVIFTEPHLDSITQNIEIEQFNPVDRVTFRLLDKDFKPVKVKYIRAELIDRDKRVRIPLDVDVTPGENYFYEWLIPEVDEDDGELPIILKIPMGNKAELRQNENQATYINEAGTIEYAFISSYDYSKDFSVLLKIVFAVVIFGAAFILNKGYEYIIDKTMLTDWLNKNSWALKRIITGVIIAVGLAALALSSVINIWGGNIDDRIVFAVGIFTLVGWGIVFIWKRNNIQGEYTSKELWRNYLQIMCFAMAIYSACRYVNAEYELIHTVNTRRIVIYTICAFILIWDEKNKPGLKIWENVKLPMFFIWTVMVAIMNIFKFDLKWPPVMIVFALPFFFKMSREGYNRLLNNVSMGVYVSFLISTVYCLIHRPYNTWIFYRYPGMFHTVAYTGMYLSIIAAVSLARIFIKNELMDYLVFSSAVGYILLSMTRAAILSVAAAFIIMFFTVTITKGNFINKLKQTILIGVVCLAGFCMVFSATRMIPAIINDPIYMDIENTEAFGICKGEKIDSPRYLRFNRYFMIMFGRFGKALYSIDEAKIEEGYLVASTNNNACFLPLMASQVADSNLSQDITNGRLDTFKAYLNNITIKPHEEFSLEYEGKTYAHAHNTILQMSYLFGIIGGLFFIAMGIATLVAAFIHYRNNTDETNALVPLAISICFMVVSMVEWTFQPGIPIGLVFMLVQVIMTKRLVDGKGNK